METSKAIGTEGELKIYVEGHVAKVELAYVGADAKGGAFVEVDLVHLIDKITDAIPGEMDDALLDGMAKKFLTKKTDG